ncbi:hypothetical protein L1049_022255 [Liquidambar formosana]|uniref:1-phosphatidylinositol 4-kinase n=1 Tax=Liquidambar formosana TaxID=63359 RepID=A0AAP0RCA2_LIQFO
MSIADVALSPIFEESVYSPGVFHIRPGFFSSKSILIYLTVAGSVIPMRILESDSIASVKLRIQTYKGCVAKKQKLIFGGRELARDDSLVRDYGVTAGKVLHLVLRLSDLLLIAVTTACGKEFEFHTEPYRNVGYLKHWIAKKKWKTFFDPEDQELFCNGERLDDQRLINDVCEKNDTVIHLLVQKSAKIRAKPFEKDIELSVLAADSNGRVDEEEKENQFEELQVVAREPLDSDFQLELVIPNPEVKWPSFIWDLIKSTFDGLERGKQAIRSPEGSGGTYFMQNSSGNDYVAVFKPTDEEPMAVNNPQGLPGSPNGEGLKRGTRVGEGALREVAAYILDHPRSGTRNVLCKEMGFAGVPPSVMVRCLHRGFNHPEGFKCSSKNVKIGSLQKFMKNYGSCEDMGPQAFPVEEVHKISVFDVRMANTDRHAGNILVSKGEDGRIVLIPIDHGYCLPETFEDCTFDWLNWPQSHQPYTPDTIDYIKSLNVEQDIAILKFHGWNLSRECARTFRISTMLLKKGAMIGLTPFAIGNIMCRKTLNKESMIEEIVREANDSLLPGMSEAAFLETVSQIMDSRLDKLKK